MGDLIHLKVKMQKRFMPGIEKLLKKPGIGQRLLEKLGVVFQAKADKPHSSQKKISTRLERQYITITIHPFDDAIAELQSKRELGLFPTFVNTHHTSFEKALSLSSHDASTFLSNTFQGLKTLADLNLSSGAICFADDLMLEISNSIIAISPSEINLIAKIGEVSQNPKIQPQTLYLLSNLICDWLLRPTNDDNILKNLSIGLNFDYFLGGIDFILKLYQDNLERIENYAREQSLNQALLTKRAAQKKSDELEAEKSALRRRLSNRLLNLIYSPSSISQASPTDIAERIQLLIMLGNALKNVYQSAQNIENFELPKHFFSDLLNRSFNIFTV